MTARPPVDGAGGGRLRASFGHAFRGIGILLRTQANARIHLLAACVVITAGFGFGISRLEWLAVVIVIGLVLAAEGVNTAVEALVDLVSPEHHPLAGRAKDLAAGAVLITAFAAAIVGALIFGSRLLAMFGR